MAAMAKNDSDVPIISGDEARAGVTGHHVRYVLGFGLAGIVIAFAILGLYFSYSRLTQIISQTPIKFDLTNVVFLAIPIALAAVVAVLVLGLWSTTRPETSQKLMRWRVILQFIALCLVMVAFYLSVR
jgi:Hypoxia induced protein conserved region